MKKSLLLFLFFIIILIIFFNFYTVAESIRFSFNICFNNVFPSIIPFLLLSKIIINYNLITELSDIFNFVMTKIFKVNKNCAFIFIMSMISGSPSNARYIKDLYDKKIISYNDVYRCLSFCHFTNPLFILGTVGYTFLGAKKIGLIILISHITSSILLGIKLKKQESSIINKSINTGNVNFINILSKSIIDTANTLVLILGVVTTFLIITCILDKIFPINPNYKFIYGLLEITQGLKYLSLSNISIKYKTMIAAFLVSFGGLSIHAQVFSILDNKKIRYLPYLISRIIHGFLSSIIAFLLLS